MQKQSESEIQRAICDYLALRHHFFWRSNNAPIFDPTKRSFRAMPKYAIKGIPDIMVVTDGGFMVFLEVKAEKGRLSEEQIAFKKKCEDKGAEYYVVRSIDEVKTVGL